MATKINAGDDAKRKDFWMVDPFQIVVREELGGRRYERDPNDVASLATSMLEYGQRQPIEVRRIEDNRLQAVFGFTRLAAAKLIREGFDWTDPATGDVVRSTVRETLLTETESSPPVSPVEETDAHESPDTTEEISPPTPPTPNNEEVRVTPPRRVKPLSPKEIRTFWEELGEKTDDDTLRDLCKTALSWLSGKRSAKTFRDALNKIVKS